MYSHWQSKEGSGDRTSRSGFVDNQGARPAQFAQASPFNETMQRKHNPVCGCGSCAPVAQLKVIGSGVIQRVTNATIAGHAGTSGNSAATKANLNATAYGRAVGNIFLEFPVNNHNGHGLFDCAEPHALSKLVRATGNGNIQQALSGAAVSDPMQQHGHGPATYLAPCNVCRQWVRGSQGAHNIGKVLHNNTRLESTKYQTPQIP